VSGSYIVENKSMRHSLGEGWVGDVGRFSRAPMIHLTLCVSSVAITSSPLPFPYARFFDVSHFWQRWFRHWNKRFSRCV